MKKFLIILGMCAFFVQCKNESSQKQEIPQNTESSSKDWALLPFVKTDSVNPVLLPDSTLIFTCPIRQTAVKWVQKDVFNPATVVRNDSIFMIFRAEDIIGKYAGTSRLGLAVSTDGFHFSKMPEPVFYPDNDSMEKYEWEGGVEDPRIVESEDERYIMTYTAYDGKVARLCLASSQDLKNWEKHGLVLDSEKYRDAWSKSGAIVCKQVGNRFVAQKINGKYWMYWGDTDLFMANSDDLIHWQAVEKMDGSLLRVLSPRPGYFDSRLVESGPFALLTKQGILLIYNSMNATTFNDVTLTEDTYSAGQALFDKENPVKLIARTDENFFKPDKPYELVGQVNKVCFLEGLVWFKDKWYLYYGTADSKIAVATCEKVLR
ncbi:MAG: glycoside hydrolase family 130 protein [Saprospiraceae bacterium]|nr:glycoside hydrolase family 130 protein [Saprospiraceae bacterium]